ncbi:hypothetical protein [Rhodospirillaceae bacterium SYSU D60014]|uniref:tetratricopeptide repeat protein n=1 Tax=Virgifigura deserti TaxID=2268457 RepID=UPI000E66DE41
MRHRPGLAFAISALLTLAARDDAVAAGSVLVQDVARLDFVTRRAELDNRIEMVEGRERAKALVDLAELYLSWGFAEEAYARMTELAEGHPEAFAVRRIKDSAKVAFLLSGQTNDPLGLREYRMSDDQHDALWRMVAAATAHEWQVTEIDLRRGVNVIDTYPPAYARQILPLLLKASLDAKDATSARFIAEVIAVTKERVLEEDCETLMVGRLADLEGHPAEAYRRYMTAASYDTHCGAGAKLELLTMDINAGVLAPGVALAQAREIAESWRGNSYEERALWLVAGLQKTQGDVVNALETLRRQTDRFPTGDLHQRARAEGQELTGRLLIEGVEALSPEQVERFRRDYMGFVTDPDLTRQIDRRYADYLAERGLYSEAAAILAKLLPDAPAQTVDIANLHNSVLWYMLRPEIRESSLQLAEMLAKGGRPQEALDKLNKIVDLERPESWDHQAMEIYVTAMAALGKLDTVIDRIDPLLAPDLTRKVARIYMKAEKWEDAFLAYDEFLQEDPDGAHDSRDYVDYAVAAYLSGYMEEASGLLQYRASAWSDGEWSSLITNLIQPYQTTEEDPQQAIDTLLEQTDSLITFGTALN